MTNKLLIINKSSFGSLTDSYKWCYYLKDRYDITFLGFDSKNEDLDMQGIRIRRVSNKGSRTIRGIRYILTALWTILFFKGKIMVVYFEHCDIFKKLLPWKRMLLDIRTLSVSDNLKVNQDYDKKLRKTCDIYDHVSLISEGIRNKLGLMESATSILPLGADIISADDKKFDKLRLLYVGTLTNRRIDVTLKALAEYIKETGDDEIEYHIVGDGKGEVLNDLKQLAYEELGLEKNVVFYGKVPHTELKPYFDKCNIGVAFVPITSYYNYQPPTKTFEYVLSGLYTIATNTYCNKQIIREMSGCLVEDDVISFHNALKQISEKKEQLHSSSIRSTLLEYTWDKIVNNYLVGILDKIG